MTNGYTLGGQTNTQRRKLINRERGSPPRLCLVVENKMSTETQGILLAFLIFVHMYARINGHRIRGFELPIHGELENLKCGQNCRGEDKLVWSFERRGGSTQRQQHRTPT